MIYITYRDLKVKDGKMADLSLQQWRKESSFNVDIDPIILQYLTNHDLKIKTEQMAKI